MKKVVYILLGWMFCSCSSPSSSPSENSVESEIVLKTNTKIYLENFKSQMEVLDLKGGKPHAVKVLVEQKDVAKELKTKLAKEFMGELALVDESDALLNIRGIAQGDFFLRKIITADKELVLDISLSQTQDTVNLNLRWNDTFSGFGDGTSSNPFLITQIDHFKNMVHHASAYFKLAADIDFSTIDNWKCPDNLTFAGVLDGSFHSLTGFKSYFPGEPVKAGLFAHNAGEISNLIIKGRNSGIPDIQAIHAGSVAYKNTGRITNCANYCLMGEGAFVGGIVGSNLGRIASSVNHGNALGAFGGIAFVNTEGGEIINCYNTGTIKKYPSLQGGIVAYDYINPSKQSTITNCYNWGTIETNGISSVGAIFAQLKNTKLTGCVYFVGHPIPNMDKGAFPMIFPSMKIKDSYTNLGWKFGSDPENPWLIEDNKLPKLYWEKEESL